MPRIPLIEDLTTEPIPPGSNLLVEFDPASEWYNAAVTITTGWLSTGGRVHYNVAIRPPDAVRSQLKKLGLIPEDLEREDKLRIYDWYSPTITRKSEGKNAITSLKVHELSPEYAKWLQSDELRENVNTLRMIENGSILARYNDEKLLLEFILTRVFPRSTLWKATLISTLVKGLHSDWFYGALEAAADGIIDFKLDETTDPAQSLIRVRNLRNVGFDGRWHKLKTSENREVTLEK
jgi:KaiC/GvpD/RAD55 family RecA-like ATPase